MNDSQRHAQTDVNVYVAYTTTLLYVLYILNVDKTHCAKKASIHQVTIMLATFKDVLFPGHNQLLTIGTDDLTGVRVTIRVSGHQYRWLAWKYNIFRSMVVTWWIVAFCAATCRMETYRRLYIYQDIH